MGNCTHSRINCGMAKSLVRSQCASDLAIPQLTWLIHELMQWPPPPQATVYSLLVLPQWGIGQIKGRSRLLTTVLVLVSITQPLSLPLSNFFPSGSMSLTSNISSNNTPDMVTNQDKIVHQSGCNGNVVTVSVRLLSKCWSGLSFPIKNTLETFIISHITEHNQMPLSNLQALRPYNEIISTGRIKTGKSNAMLIRK